MLIFQSIIDQPVGLPLPFLCSNQQPTSWMVIFQSIMDQLVGMPKSLFSSPTNQLDVYILVHKGPAGGNPTVCISVSNQLARCKGLVAYRCLPVFVWWLRLTDISGIVYIY